MRRRGRSLGRSPIASSDRLQETIDDGAIALEGSDWPVSPTRPLGLQSRPCAAQKAGGEQRYRRSLGLDEGSQIRIAP